MKTVLVPLDGSRLGEQVLPYVRLLVPALEARVLLLRVITESERDSLLSNDVTAFYGLAGDALAEAYERDRRHWEELRLYAEEYLERCADDLRTDGLEVDTEVSFGVPARQIVEVAEREHAAMIAMAAHDYSAFQRWAIGSVTDKVVHSSNVPFFIVRGNERLTVNECRQEHEVL